MAGLTPEGFERKTFETVRDEMAADVRATISPTMDTGDDAIAGKFIGIVGAQIAELWEMGEGVYAASHPNGAAGVLLDHVVQLVGTRRRDAKRSLVEALVVLDGGYTLAAGHRASVDGQPDRVFRLRDDVSNFAAAEAQVSAVFESLDKGPIVANAGTLTVIEDREPAWKSITNPLDAQLGAGIELDPALRARRITELSSGGGPTLPAIVSAVGRVRDVASVTGLENTTARQAGSLPPKSFELLVQGGTDQDVAERIFRKKGAGIQAYGEVVVNVRDDRGEEVPIGFSRPTARDLHMAATVTLAQPVPDEAGFRDALREFVAQESAGVLALGREVSNSRLASVFHRFDPGLILDVDLRLGFSAPPTSTENLPVATRELAVADTSRIEVTVQVRP